VTIFRWKAIVPLLLFTALVVALWTLYADRVIRKTVEFVGTDVMGARVELDGASLHTARGLVVLDHLQVTDPRSPMTNLVEVGEIVARLNVRALLEKKAVIETLAVRGVRFGTPRRESGAVDTDLEHVGVLPRRLFGFAASIPTPPLDLSGLGELAQWRGVSADSLRTPRQAQAVAASGDSVKTTLEAQLRAADPEPAIDSARALAERLRVQNPRTLGVAGTTRALADVRASLAALQDKQRRIAALKTDVAQGVGAVRAGVASLEEARRADYAYARGLVRIPSLAAPDLSASVFQDLALERLQPVLDWLARAEQYLPPGLRPRRTEGPERLRMSGTTFQFPKAEHFPTMLVRYAETDLAIGGRSALTGAYRAVAQGITTEPASYGRPLTFAATRSAAATGPERIRVAGAISRLGGVSRDSLEATLTGVELPSAALRQVGAHLALGTGNMQLFVARRGEQLLARWHVESDRVAWRRLDTTQAAQPPESLRLGSREWADALLWRTVSGLSSVAIDARISGTLSAPRVDISSNVGAALSASLQREVGAEVRRLEARARAEVDRAIARPLAEARAKVTQLRSGVEARVAEAEARLNAVKEELEAKLRELASQVPQLPGGLPRIPRP
jgi:uncharacterized protein (TIGR03545 family)